MTKTTDPAEIAQFNPRFNTGHTLSCAYGWTGAAAAAFAAEELIAGGPGTTIEFVLRTNGDDNLADIVENVVELVVNSGGSTVHTYDGNESYKVSDTSSAALLAAHIVAMFMGPDTQLFRVVPAEFIKVTK